MDDEATRIARKIVNWCNEVAGPQELDIAGLIRAYGASAEWQPIATAPKGTDYANPIDLWVVNNKRSWRVPNCHESHGDKGAWINSDGKWVSGGQYLDEKGGWCWAIYPTLPEHAVVTHWMRQPGPPIDLSDIPEVGKEWFEKAKLVLPDPPEELMTAIEKAIRNGTYIKECAVNVMGALSAQFGPGWYARLYKISS